LNKILTHKHRFGILDFEKANSHLSAGGTLFLDEIGELPMILQVKVLKAIQEKTFRRVAEQRTSLWMSGL